VPLHGLLTTENEERDISITETASRPVPKKKPDPIEPPTGEGKQLGLRLSAELLREVEFCADALGLEASPFIRMVLVENIAKYKRRAERVKAGDSPIE
jgi:hypothetical protein